MKTIELNVPKKTFIGILIAFGVFIAAGIILLLLSMGLNSGNTANTSEISPVRINEIMTANHSAYPDCDGYFYDWAELYNTSDKPVDISDCSLSNKEGSSFWLFPKNTIIEANGYLVIYLSGQRRNGLYTSFKLSANTGERLYLYDTHGNVADSVMTISSEENKSMVRDHSSDTMTFSDAFTPGYENSDDGYKAYLDSLHDNNCPIIINEIMAINHMTLKDSFGDYSDWIELKNCGNESVNIENYFISDDTADPYKWSVPALILEPGEVHLLYASGKNTVTENGEIHMGFRLSEYNTTLCLSTPSGKLAYAVSYEELGENQSYALNQSGVFAKTYFPTPFFENTDFGYEYSVQLTDTVSGLVINEIKVRNTSTLRQNGGKYYDWIELYNTSDSEISLRDYYLSTSHSDLFMWQLPDIALKSGGYIVFVCSGDTDLTTSQYYHAPFRISAEYEEVYLTHADGTEADAVCIHDVQPGFCYGRVPGKSGFFYIENSTPSGRNNGGIRMITDSPVASTEEGVYNDVDSVDVELVVPTNDAVIYYTLDCNEPTTNSRVYTGAFKLTDTTIIRACAVQDGRLMSPVMTYSYIINENHTLPVVSLTAEPDDLFSSWRGIYSSAGAENSNFPYITANFWRDWERTAHLTLFENSGVAFSEQCGIEMFGNWGRAYDKKPFQISFKEEYGATELTYPLFEDNDRRTFSKLVLRAGSQDWYRSVMRDELFTSLAGDGSSSIVVQDYKTCVLYINGRYWGVYHIREKVDEELISQRMNVSESSINLLSTNGTVIYGSNEDYQALVNYVTSHNMANDTYYNYVTERLDVVSLIDYKIAQAYSANTDLHNMKYFNSSESDGKWRYVLFDMDLTFGTTYGSIARTLGGTYVNLSNTMTIRLLKNTSFKELYLTRLAMHLKTTFSQEKVLARIDEIYETMKPEMQRNCVRWGQDYDEWEEYIQRLRNFCTGKVSGTSQATRILREVRSFFYLSDAEYNRYFSDIAQ